MAPAKAVTAQELRDLLADLEGVLQEATMFKEEIAQIKVDIQKLKSAFGGMSIVVD